jgi:hypothetical protein
VIETISIIISIPLAIVGWLLWYVFVITSDGEYVQTCDKCNSFSSVKDGEILIEAKCICGEKK